MSRIGKKPIQIPAGVKVTLVGQAIKVEGPKGQLERVLHDKVQVKMEADQRLVSLVEQQSNTALTGLTRSLVANMLTGVSSGFERVLEIPVAKSVADRIKGPTITESSR